MPDSIRDPDKIKKAKEIELYLKQEKKRFEQLKKEPKVLILGSSDSGKSTLLKQLKIIYSDGFTIEEKKHSKQLILSNLLTLCTTLLDIHKSGFEKLEEFTHGLVSGREGSFLVDTIPENVVELMVMMWNDSKSQKFLTGLQPPVPDSTTHFINRLPELAKLECIPTQEDILLLRTVTQTVSETIFNINMNNQIMRLHVFDVSGLMHHRKHWISYFDDVVSVLFIVSLSCYDQFMVEDHTINRMHDSLKLFEDIVNHPLFKETNMMIFLNKKDLYEKKLPNIPIKNYFPDYEGKPLSKTEGLQYFKQKFMALDKSGKKRISYHATCCTDTKLMSNIVANVMISIQERLLNEISR
ncbi:guanine nucleotide binding protein, alpha subunit [Globomyces pollinis-pini]|nr:guanine nucleotide binding protein, alpha subunit [Globomyces pollinis-pini]